MEDENKIPLLLEFLFGEAAQAAQRGASERLRRWGRAFDDWLAERRRRADVAGASRPTCVGGAHASLGGTGYEKIRLIRWKEIAMKKSAYSGDVDQ